MKRYRALCAAVLTAVCVFIPRPATYAIDSGDTIVSMQINNPIMEVNGEEKPIDESGTSPLIINGRTLVPIRSVIEAFGGTVGWNQDTRSVLLEMNGDSVTLTIDSHTAYVNGREYTIDTPPEIINERTMQPIRFIAESFNLGVAWDEDNRTVSVIRNVFSDSEYEYLEKILPGYSGMAYTEINDNKPFFKDYEIIGGSFEYYASLDELGRCDVCLASVGEDIMPTGARESISSVKPTGWQSVKYDNVDGGYLYNRCHLIGFQLTGENANERNLVTGTRYLNVDGMLPFENYVSEYVKRTGNNVMYRVTPVFSMNNLVCDGVLMEAYSVEDDGAGISFCVYCYNVQPDIVIDYATGASYSLISQIPQTDSVNYGVYRTPNGSRYHYDPVCGGKNSYSVTLADAIAAGLTPCKKCVK